MEDRAARALIYTLRQLNRTLQEIKCLEEERLKHSKETFDYAIVYNDEDIDMEKEYVQCHCHTTFEEKEVKD